MKRPLRAALFYGLQAVIAAEITLQVLALVLPHLGSWSSRAVDPAATAPVVTILSVGDSHTYGAPLPPEESYPSQLQELLNARGEREYRVVNLGVPGMNTAPMANRFEANLRRYRPDLVILWGGANNIWNETETETAASDDGVLDRLYRAMLRLKLVRLVLFLGSEVSQADPGRAEPLDFWSFRQGDEVLRFEEGEPVPTERAARRVRQDLPRMVRLAQAYGIPILLVTYPYREFAWTNDATRDVGRDLGVEMLETFEDLQRAKADGYTNEELIVMAAGPHPRKTLYGYIASSMVPVVLQLLENE